MERVGVIILAAGKGSRMHSKLAKPLHVVGGMPLLEHILQSIQQLPEQIGNVAVQSLVVHAPEQDDIVALARAYEAIPITQAERLGTAHALQQCRSRIHQERFDRLLILFGDTPFISCDLMVELLDKLDSQTALSLGVFEARDGGAYGRVELDSQGAPQAIIEARDASFEQLRISLCNGGAMAMTSESLCLLEDLDNNNQQKEYMLPHVVALARAQGFKVAMSTASEEDFMGVNSLCELAEAEAVFQRRRRLAMMASGVRLLAPETVFFSHDTRIACDVTIEPYVYFGLGVDIGESVHIRSFCYIEGVVIGKGAIIGAFARIRAGSEIGADALVGNFTEVKNSRLGKGVKAAHLSYLGDSDIGDFVNIGASVITCNYDGKEKHATQIGGGSFIGAHSSLIAPISIGADAKIAAATVVSEDVGEGEFTISRAPQRTRPSLKPSQAKHRDNK